LISAEPSVYFRPPHVGVARWVGVELSRVDDEQLGALIREAFRLMAVKKTVSRDCRDVALKLNAATQQLDHLKKCYSSPGGHSVQDCGVAGRPRRSNW
jgi:hypothetical protein